MSGSGLVWTYSWTVGSGNASLNETANVIITVNDAAGNANNAATSETSFVIDNNVPTVVLSDNEADNIVKDGDVVSITATFTDAIGLGSNIPEIQIGSDINSAVAMSGSGLVWTYSWTVGSGNANLNETANVIITVNDAAGNANNTATGETSFIIDNTAPTVVLSDNEADNIVKDGDVVSITATFTESNGLGSNIPQIQIGSDISSAVSMSGSGLVWTYSWTVGSGNVSLNETANVIITVNDVVGNVNNPATGETSFVIDNTAPSVVLSDDEANNIVKDGDVVSITATFTDAIGLGSNIPEIQIGSDISSAVSMSGSGLVWTYSWTVGSVTSSLNESANIIITVNDAAGNANATATGEISFVVDNVSPTVLGSNLAITGTSSGNGDYYIINDIVTAAWDNTVSGDNNDDISAVDFDFSEFGGGSVAASEVSPGLWRTTYTIVDNAFDIESANSQNVFVSVTDDAGNITSAIEGSDNVSVDNVAPTIAIFNPLDNASGIAVNTSIALTFSENINSSFGSLSLTSVQNQVGDLQSFAASNGSIVTINSTTVTIEPANALAGSRDYFLNISTTAFVDDQGNPFGGIADQTTYNFQTGADDVPPVLTITVSPPSTGSSTITADNELTYLLSYNEEIIGMADSDIILVDVNSAFASESFSLTRTGARTFEVKISGLITTGSNGDVRIDINNNSGQITDGANPFVGPQSSSVVTIDQTDPILTYTDFNTNDQTPIVTGTVDEDLAVTVRIDGQDYIAAAGSHTGSGPFTWSITTNSLVESSFSVQVFADDAAENRGTTSGIMRVDVTPPNIVSSTQYDSLLDGSIDQITVRFNEAVLDATLSVSDFIISGESSFTLAPTGSAINATDPGIADDAFITFIVDEIVGTGTVNIDFTGSITDAVGNQVPTEDEIAQIDAARPFVLQSHQFDLDNDGGIDAIVMEFSEPVRFSTVESADFIVTGATSVSASSHTVDATENQLDEEALDRYITLAVDDNNGDFTGIAGTSVVEVQYSSTTGSNRKVADLQGLTAYDALSADIEDIDLARPVITSVVSTDGTYIENEIVTIELNVSEDVTVFGTPQIQLETGATDQLVNFTSNTVDNSILTFEYTVLLNHESGDLDYLSTGALTLNGGTIQDQIPSPNNLLLTLPQVAGGNSLSDNNDVVIDAVRPTFLNAFQYDTDADGNIDEIVLEMSENVNNASFEIADFILGSGDVLAILSSADVNLDNNQDVNDMDSFVTLSVDVSGTADVSVEYNANGGGGTQVQDLNGNFANNNASITTVDEAKPIFLNAYYQDTDADGDIDEVAIEFSETVLRTSAEANDFTLGLSFDESASAVNNVINGTSAFNNRDTNDADEYITLGITVSGTEDVTLNYEKTRGGAFQLADDAGNEVDNVLNPSFINVVDEANPILLRALQGDADADGNIDRIVIEVSEPFDATNTEIDDFVVDGDATGGNLAELLIFANTAPANDYDEDDFDAYLTLQVEIEGTSAVTVSYDGSSNDGAFLIEDFSGNAAINGSVTEADVAPPQFLNAVFFDHNEDGNIDEILLEMSEPVSNVNFEVADFNIADGLDGSTSTIDLVLNEFGNGANPASNGFDVSASDEYVSLAVTVNGTGKVFFEYFFNNNSTQVQDADGNPTGDNDEINLIDAAAPRIANAYFFDNGNSIANGSINEVVLEFTENLDESSDWFNELGTANFTLGDGFDGLNSQSSSINGTLSIVVNSLDASSTDQYITLEADISGTSTVALAYNQTSDPATYITDSENNDLADNFVVSNLIDGAAPVLLGAFFFDNNEDGNIEEITYAYSEPIDIINDFEAADFTIDDSFFGSTTKNEFVNNDDANGGTNDLVNNDLDASDSDNYATLSVLIRGTETVFNGYFSNGGGKFVNDASGNQSLNQFSDTAFDNLDYAVPQFLNAYQYDADFVDGNIDEIVIEMSERIDFNKFESADFTLGNGLKGDLSNHLNSAAVTASETSNPLDFDNDQYATFKVEVSGTAPITIEYNSAGGSLSIVEDESSFSNEANDLSAINAVDRAAPYFFNTYQYDHDADGNIEEIVIEMSEPISNASFEGDDFNIDFTEGLVSAILNENVSGVNPAQNDLDDSALDRFVTLQVNVEGTAVVDVDYSADNDGTEVKDQAGNEASNDETFTYYDLAAPRITEAKQYDIDLDGNIDQVLLTFTEPMSESLGWFTDFDASNFTLGDGFLGDASSVASVISSATASGQNTTDVEADDEYITIAVSVVGSSAVSVFYEQQGSSNIEDASGNLLVDGYNIGSSATFGNIVDAASPQFYNGYHYDHNDDGIIEEVVIEMSEPVNNATFDADDWILGNGLNGSSRVLAVLNEVGGTGAAANSLNAFDLNANDQYVTLSVSIPGTSVVNVDYSQQDTDGINIADLVGNLAENDETIVSVDLAKPRIKQTLQYDVNLDGNIDEIVIEMTEPVTNVSFHEGDFLLGVGLDGISSESLDVLDHNSGTTPALNAVDQSLNDRYVTLSVDVNGTGDVTLDYDLSGETTLEIEDLASTPNLAINQSSTTNLDRAIPQFLSARQFDTGTGNGNIDEIVIEISEVVSVNNFERGDFILGVGLNGSLSTVTGVLTSSSNNNGIDQSAADQYITLATSITGTGAVSVEYNRNGSGGATVQDDVNNQADNLGSLTLIDQAAPVALSAAQYDLTSDGNIDQIIVEFSENLSASNAESGDFILGSGSVSSVNTTTTDEFITLAVEVTGTATVQVGYDGNLSGSNILNDGVASPGPNNVPSINSITVSDQAIPRIINVTSSTANGLYQNGDIVGVEVVYSEVVTVNEAGGSPVIRLETGGIDQTVGYTSGSNSNTLLFDYTVQVGDVSSDLTYLNPANTSPFLANGSVIQDISINKNVANNAMPTLGTKDLASNKDLVIDGILPLIQAIYQYDVNSDGNIDEIVIQLNEVTNYNSSWDKDQFRLSAGTVEDIIDEATALNPLDLVSSDAYITLKVSVTGTSAVNVVYTPNNANSAVRLTDLAGNELQSQAILSSSSQMNDEARPVILNVTSTVANGAYNEGEIIPIVFTLSESVTVTGTPQITLETGDVDRIADYSSGTSTSTLTFNYTVVGPIAPSIINGDNVLDLSYQDGTLTAGTSVQDQSVNRNNLDLSSLPVSGATSSLSANKNLEIDTTIPALQSTTAMSISTLVGTDEIAKGDDPNDDGTDVADVVVITMDFNDNLLSAPVVTVRSGGFAINNVVSLQEINPTNEVWTATFTVNRLDADGAITFTVGYTDKAGNQGNTLTQNDTYGSAMTIDNTNPSVTYSVVNNPTLSDPYVLTANFSEKIEGLTIGDFTVTTSNAEVTNLQNTISNTWTLDVNPSDGQTANVTVELNDDAATDVAGNTISATAYSNVFDDESPILTSSNVVFGQSLTLTVSQSEVGEIYYAIFDDGETVDTDKASIKAQATGTLTTARIAGVANGLVTDAVANFNYVVSETLPELRTNYDLKVATEDKVNPNFNLSEPTNIDITSGGIVITAPNLTDICLEGNYFSLGDIVLAETISTDFVSSNSSKRTLNLQLPENFEFNTTTGSVGDNGGDVDVDPYAISYIGNNTVVISYDILTTASLDVVTISGLMVRAKGSTTTNNATITRSGGTGNIFEGNVGDEAVFATLSTVAPFDSPEVDVASAVNPYISENDSGILGDEDGDGVTVYDADAANLLVSTPFTVHLINENDIVNVYSNAGLTSLVTSYIATTASDSYTPSVEDLLGSDASLVDMGVNTFWITTQRGTTINACESAPTKFSVAIIRTENSANTSAFTLDNSFGTTLTFSYPTTGHTNALFFGNGLSGKNDQASFTGFSENGSSIQFIPSAAANETTVETVTYTLTNNEGVEANYSILLYLTESNFVLSDTTEIGNYQTRTYCQDGSSISLLVSSPSGVDVNGESSPNPDFLSIRVFDYSSGSRGKSLTSTVFSSVPDTTISESTNLSGWVFDPTSLDDTAPLTGANYLYNLEFVYVILDDLTNQETELTSEIVQIYRLPTVEINNFRNTLTLSDSAYYSNDDAAFNISTSVTYNDSLSVVTDAFTIDSYDIYKYDGSAYILEASVLDANFDPADPDNDGTRYPESEEFGLYRIIYNTATEADASVARTFTPAACNNMDTVDFEILQVPNYPGIVTDNTSTDIIEGVSDGDLGNGYLLEYCEGTTINFLSIDLSSFGTENVLVKWYSDSLKNNMISNNISGANNETINIANQFFGGNTNPTGRQSAQFYYSVTDNIDLKTGVSTVNASSTKNGSESETNRVVVQVYPDPDSPVVNGLSNTNNLYQYEADSRNSFNSAELRDQYYFEYCIPDGGIVTLQDVLIDASLDQNQPTESYFILYNSSLVAVDSFQTVNATTDYSITGEDILSLLNYTPSDSSSAVFYLSQRDHDNNYPADDNQYVGCESSLRKFNISVNVIPRIPNASRFSGGYNNSGIVEYYLCSGEALNDISAPTTQRTGNQSYTWYRQVDLGIGDSITTSGFNNRSITMNDLLDENDLDTANNTNVTQTYSYYVTQTFSTNVETGFRGCESDYTQVDINVIPDPTAPIIQDTVRYEESFCAGTTAGVSYTVRVNTGATLNIYSASETQFEGVSSRGTLIETLTDNDRDNLITINSDNLGIGSLSETIVYFKLSQQTNIEVDGSQFEGCETEIQDMSRIKLYVYNLPSDPIIADRSLYYCDSEDVSAVIASNVEAGGFVQWYDRNNNLLYLDENEDGGITSTILANQLTLNGAHKSDSTYLFKLLQRTDANSGVDGFLGCSSVGVGARASQDTLSFTISVVRTPDPSEIFTDVDGNRCEYEFNNSSTRIDYAGVADWLRGSPDPNSQSSINYFSFWKVSNPDINSDVDAFRNGSEVTRATPTEVGTFTINISELISGTDDNISSDSVLNVYVTQTVGQIASQAFAGCTSPIKLDTMNLYPEPAAPEFLLTTNTAKNNNGEIVITSSASDKDLSWSNYTYTFCDESDASADVFAIADPKAEEKYAFYDNRNAGEAKIDENLNRINLNFTEASGFDLLNRLTLVDGKYSGAASQSYYVTTIRNGCETQQLNRNEIEAIIGEIPDPVFRWSGLTASLNNTILEIEDNNRSQRRFEDSVRSTRVIINGLDNPLQIDQIFNSKIDSIQFAEVFPNEVFDDGSYRISVSMTSTPTCTQFSYDDTDSSRIMTLLPTYSLDTQDGSIANDRYDENFDSQENGWLIDQRDYTDNGYQDRSGVTASSWTYLNTRYETNDGSTGATYNNNEHSWIYSPNFQTLSLNNPIVGFLMNYEFGDNRDGVVLQYTIDDGVTWLPVGSYSSLNEVDGVDINGSSGNNWYLSNTIESEPGQYSALSSLRGRFQSGNNLVGYNQNGFGWARAIPDGEGGRLTGTGEELIEALNSIPSNENIRFRFALGSNAAGQGFGFVLDDFKIFDGEKVPLIETFNSAESQEAKNAFVYADNMLSQGDDFIWINYFTDLASTGARDQLNEINQIDPSARVGYYGVGQVPNSAIDGVIFQPLGATVNTDDSLKLLGWNATIRDKALLADRSVNIFDESNSNGDLQLTEVGDEFTLDLQVSFEILVEGLKEISLKIAIIEKEVSFPAIADPGNSSIKYSEGEIVKNVLRKILPAADGIVYQDDLTINRVISENIVWSIKNINDLTQMAVVIFVQDDVSKKVLQAKEVLISEIAATQKQDPPTGLENLFGSDDIYLVYPNPANNHFTIHLEKISANDLSWSLYDQSGRTVRNGKIEDGTAGLVVPTDQIPSGVYLLELHDDNNKWSPRKIIIQH
ncbi:MAG: Ig-like domain-containing protein [Cyclobacteriaceae bacterium]